MSKITQLNPVAIALVRYQDGEQYNRYVFYRTHPLAKQIMACTSIKQLKELLNITENVDRVFLDKIILTPNGIINKSVENKCIAIVRREFYDDKGHDGGETECIYNDHWLADKIYTLSSFEEFKKYFPDCINEGGYQLIETTEIKLKDKYFGKESLKGV